MKTMIPTAAQARRTWYVVDADGKVLGRLATRIATVLRGKHKALFTPHMDTGDFVVVVNAKAVRLTGRKRQQKKMYRHSGYPGGLRETSYETLLKNHPERVITEAVKGMLPKTRQGRQLLKKLKVYAGPAHEHQAQKPAPLSV
jgi:large subunit ribosomal protein L13